MGRLNLGLFGYRFKADDSWLSYQSAYGRSARILKSDIESVSLAQGKKRGKSVVQINGKGTVLATVELPRNWAQKAQEFILRETGKLS